MNAPTASRRAVLAAPLGIPAAASAATTAHHDAALLTLLAATRAAEAAYADACRADDDDAMEAASERLETALAEMAAIPAQGALGALVKAARLCRSLDGGAGIMFADMPVVASLQADLARLAPGVVA